MPKVLFSFVLLALCTKKRSFFRTLDFLESVAKNAKRLTFLDNWTCHRKRNSGVIAPELLMITTVSGCSIDDLSDGKTVEEVGRLGRQSLAEVFLVLGVQFERGPEVFGGYDSALARLFRGGALKLLNGRPTLIGAVDRIYIIGQFNADDR